MTTGLLELLSCAKLQSNHHHQQTNIQLFYRPDALPVAQSTVTVCGRVAEWVGRWTCDQQVASSNPGLSAIECNPAQVANTHASVTKQYSLVPANGR